MVVSKHYQTHNLSQTNAAQSCVQSYKHYTLINYDSRLETTSKLLILTTLES